MSKQTKNKNLDTVMMEKYLHSQGAALCGEGRFDEAVRLLYDAISIEDQPYTRYQLSQAYQGKGDLDKALEEISRAITLNKSIPEYYYERKEIWLMKGDFKNAQIDIEKMLKLDKHYKHIREIHNAVKAFRRVFLPGKIDRWPDATKIRHKALREAISDFIDLMALFRGNIESSTCTLPCPAYCCHFSGETITHGLSIGPWKLLAIRNFLKDQGLPEKDFFCKMTLSGDRRVFQLIPPHHTVREGGNPVIYFPARHKGRLSDPVLCSMPKDINYKTLVWINKNARPCAFLKDKRCMIHDLGGEPGLPACKEFLCMTGLVFIVLDQLGVVSKNQTSSIAFEDLNRIAIESLLVISRELLEHPDLIKQKKMMKTLLKKALKGDKEGNKNLVNSLLRQYSVAKNQYGNLFASQRKKIKKEVIATLQSISNE